MQTESELAVPFAERSPLEYFHGLYLQDAISFGGATAFCWFADDAEALAYLRERLVLVYMDVDGESEDVQAVRTALGAALHEVSSLTAIDLDAVNAALAGLCELRWAGSLDDLRSGDRPFERGVQDDFHHNVFGDERGMGESGMGRLRPSPGPLQRMTPMRSHAAHNLFFVGALLLWPSIPVLAANARLAQPSVLANPTENPYLQVGMDAVASGLRTFTVSLEVGAGTDLSQRINHVHFGMSLSGWHFVAHEVVPRQGGSPMVLLTYGRRVP